MVGSGVLQQFLFLSDSDSLFVDLFVLAIANAGVFLDDILVQALHRSQLFNRVFHFNAVGFAHAETIFIIARVVGVSA